MEALEWTGKKGFNEAELGPWKVDGKVAGTYKTSENLTVRTLSTSWKTDKANVFT